MCPQTILRFIFRDLIQTKLLKLRRNTKDKQREPIYSKTINKIKLISSYIIFVIIATTVAINFMLYFVSYEYFFANVLDLQNHFTLFAFCLGFGLIAIYLVTITKENFCIYACPYARVQSILYDKHTFTAVYNLFRGGHVYKDNKKSIFRKKDFTGDEECIACEQCVKICPTGIDIRKGLQLECIECLECVDACTDVMSRVNKKSLITWNSEASINHNDKTKLVRTKSIAYSIAIIAIVGLLIFNAGIKTNFQLNINRTSQLFSEQKTKINNAYLFLFQNTDNKDHEYYFEIDNKDIKILRPSSPFSIKAKSKSKKIVALSIDKTLLSKYKNEKIKIKIIAYEINNKESKVIRDGIFIFPLKK
jgi:cytochrome c oxidase accessory protein FixG